MSVKVSIKIENRENIKFNSEFGRKKKQLQLKKTNQNSRQKNKNKYR